MRSLEDSRRSMSLVASQLEAAVEMAKAARNCRYRTSIHALANELTATLKLAMDQIEEERTDD